MSSEEIVNKIQNHITQENNDEHISAYICDENEKIGNDCCNDDSASEGSTNINTTSVTRKELDRTSSISSEVIDEKIKKTKVTFVNSIDDIDDCEIDKLEDESEEELKRNERFKGVRSDSFRLRKTQSTKVANIGGKLKINDEVTKLEEEIRLVIGNNSDYVLHPSEMFYVKKDKLHLPVRSLTTNLLEFNHLDKFNEDLKKEEKKKEEQNERTYVKRFYSKKNVKFSVKKVVFEYNDNKELPDFVPNSNSKSKRNSILSTRSKFSNLNNKEIPNLSESSEDDSADSSDDGELSSKEKEKLNELKRKRQEREIAKKVELEEELRRKEEIEKILSEEKLSKKNSSKSNSSGKNSKNNSNSSGSKKVGKKK
jgi:hypothetical protein